MTYFCNTAGQLWEHSTIVLFFSSIHLLPLPCHPVRTPQSCLCLSTYSYSHFHAIPRELRNPVCAYQHTLTATSMLSRANSAILFVLINKLLLPLSCCPVRTPPSCLCLSTYSYCHFHAIRHPVCAYQHTFTATNILSRYYPVRTPTSCGCVPTQTYCHFNTILLLTIPCKPCYPSCAC